MDIHSISLITTLLLVFIAAILGGIVAKRLSLPALLGYIASGVVFGNIFISRVDRGFLEIIADIGVTLLLFTIGVEFSFHRLRKTLRIVSWPAALQICVTVLATSLLFLILGYGYMPALYFAVASSLSSTAIIVKMLSERGELESVPGELTTGWLVFQDLSVIPIMILLPTIALIQASGALSPLAVAGAVLMSLLKSGAALVIIYYLGKRGVPRLLSLAAGSNNRELFLLSTVGVVFLSAIVTYSLGLSAALGAFIAGLLVSETSQNHSVFAEIRPLRDLFAVVFFVSLGMVLPIEYIVRSFPVLLGLALSVMLLKWFLVFGLTRYLGNHRKTAFVVALAMMQMSEFGFIIAREGVDIGVLTSEKYIFLVAYTFITMFIGTLLFSRSHEAYYWFYRTVGRIFPRVFSNKQELTPNTDELSITNHIVICGYGRVGKYIGRALEMAQIPYIVVDYNQSTVTDLRLKGVQVIYGDPADKDVLDHAQVDFARAVIIAIPDRHTQEMVIANAQTLNRHVRIICRSHHEEDQKHLKSLGVQTIVQPEFEAALSVISRILPEFGILPDDLSGKIMRLKIEHGLG